MVSARLADGEVFDSAKLKNTVRFLIENDMRNVVIDLGNLEYLYSDTINAFIASNRHMLEVSGRIAILTEHPKVQDILKRAGLDNIMRIYRSEAEMIADSKEILRQTSSYRIEELQKISNQPAEAPAIPKTEFDEFKAEMGQRLGSKLDNNELPQYQLGLNANTPAPSFQAPTPPAENGYPTFNPPQGGFAPTQLPESPAPIFPQPAPAYNYNANGLGLGNGSQGYQNPTSAQGFGQPQANFDFPTVQLPVGQFGNLSQPQASAQPPATDANTPASPAQGHSYDSDADMPDPRQRKPSQERMRSPNARKQPGRRVGGREFGGQDEESIPAYAEEQRAPEPPREEKYSSYGDLPPARQNNLVEEARFPAKLIIFVLLVGVAIGAFFFFSKKSPPPEIPSAIETPATPTGPAAPASPSATAPAAQPGPASPAQTAPSTPANPQATGPAAQPTPAQPTATTPPASAPATPPAAVPAKPAPAKALVETPRPAPHKAPATHVAKTRPRVERPAPAPAPSEEPSAPKAGMLHITSEPEGAEVLVNFSKKGVTPLDVSLSNNSNKIIVRMAGYKRFETTLPKNSTEHDLQVALDKEGGNDEPVAKAPAPKAAAPEPEERKPEPKPAPKYDEPEDLPVAKQAPAREPEDEPKPKAAASSPAPGDGPIGVIFLSSSPARADIIIDGKNSGKKTPAKLELPSGTHRIEMNKGGQKSSVDQVVNEGKNKALHLILQ